MERIEFCAPKSTPYSGDDWQHQEKSVKKDKLGQEINKDNRPGSFPNLIATAELFVEDMNTSFNTVADDLPYQALNLQKRPKLIHSVGVIADAVWKVVPNNLGYTGVFASGCTHGFIRLSLAREPKPNERTYTPGIGFKCLRNQVPSANMFAMYSLEGQDSWNFFANDLSNHGPDISYHAPFLVKQLREVFAKASNWPLMIGCSDFARYDQDGNEFSPVFPFRLAFHPTTILHNSFPDTPQEPAEDFLARGLSQPQDLYYVYAVPNPGDPMEKWVQIATIATTVPAKTSHFGDSQMFFKHTRMEEDMKIRPEWIEPTKKIIENERSQEYYTHPTMPFLDTPKSKY